MKRTKEDKMEQNILFLTSFAFFIQCCSFVHVDKVSKKVDSSLLYFWGWLKRSKKNQFVLKSVFFTKSLPALKTFVTWKKNKFGYFFPSFLQCSQITLNNQERVNYTCSEKCHV